jgi:hypothetical protein
MAWAAAAVVGGSILGGVLSGNAAKDAAGVQAAAGDRATAETARQYEQNRQDMMPWHDAGVGALSQLTDGTKPGGDFNRSFTLADFNADPGLAFRMQQGRDAVEGSAAARGGLLSGGNLTALTNYGQQFGSQEYGKAYDRFNNDMSTRFNRLSSIAGNGQTATTNTAQMDAAATESANQTRMGSANATASGIMGQANGLTNGINGGINGYMSLNMLNRFQPNGIGSTTPNFGVPTQMSGSPGGAVIA